MPPHPWFESDPDRAPDSDFEPGDASHLCVGNEGRLLDFRRTPVRVKEYVKAHRVAVARSGLASYRGKVIRDPSLTAGPLGFERRKKHVLARMGWVQALLRRCGRESIVLYRMESCDGRLQPRRRETALVSASFRMDIVQEMSGWADLQRTVALYRQAVPVERVFMTYLETEALNRPFREAETVLLADPSNPAF